MIIYKGIGLLLSFIGITGVIGLIVLTVLMDINKKEKITTYRIAQISIGVIIFNAYVVIGSLVTHEEVYPGCLLIIPVISYIPVKILKYIHKNIKKESLI